ncbi:MAG: PQQ-dependent sugar dehydrogenase [Azospirillaceae bacterium]
MIRETLAAIAIALGLAPAQADAEARTVDSATGPVRIETVATGLEHPWGVAFLPEGDMLVTERPGRLRRVAAGGSVSEPLAGGPDVAVTRQGGLLDLALDPDFEDNRLVYMTYAERGDGGISTAVARGRLAGDALEDLEVIFRQRPRYDGPNHFGSRLAFAPDGTLYVTLGERFEFEPAQALDNHLGKVVRINPDGSVPEDNPFVGRDDALPEIWSYGHRNPQGAAIHPETGRLWMHEHGPRGGDEINVPEAGANHGWPEVSWGDHYSGGEIPDPPAEPQFADAAFYWNPVIAASGMDFYTGDRFEAWTGDLLVGGLVAAAVVRLDVDGLEVEEIERIPMNARVRQVAEGPDGAVYVLTDAPNGSLLRLTPAGESES